MNIQTQTLAAIVTADHKAVPVLEKYQLDFCCKGKRTLAEACAEKGINIESITAELEQLTSPTSSNQMPFTDMSAEQLINYILIHHHFYVKQAMPQILAHLEKVAAKHGQNFPHMQKVLQLFTAVKEELTLHMQKEELVLFPRIKEVMGNTNHQYAPGYINNPVHQMEHEHDHAGNLMAEINNLTNHYTAPENACTTFKVCLEELKYFEEDLHKHVHLENYILFPMAQEIPLHHAASL
jgi:regulator of cell morphogenesis and NO signaling